MPRILLVVTFAVWAGAMRPAAADALDDIRARGTLRWGGDQEGGGPFVFPDENNPEILRGFEVEIANLLAAELGVKAEFQQGQWDGLPSLLDRRMIDVVLNGYELTPDRQARYRCTRPYYVYGLQLMAPLGGPITSWKDLARPRPVPLKVGVLVGSAAEQYLRDHFNEMLDIRTYDGTTPPMQHTQDGVLDATLQDDCIAVFYAGRFPKSTFVERPVGIGYYVALVHPEDERLQAEINRGLERLLEKGVLEDLYDRWDMSGRAQMLALRGAQAVPPAASRTAADILSANAVVLLKAAAMTVFLSAASMPLAMAVGLLVAVGRLYGPGPVRWILGVYVEVLRGTPLMLQLYAIFFLLPQLGVVVPPLVAAVVGLAVNYSAYEAEIYRAGLQAIPRGQMEAALALGMSQGLALRRIILPQAVRLVIPPVTNDFIALFKDTSVCSVVTVVELTKRYNVLAQSTGAVLELAIVTAVLYLLMSYPLSLFARYSEQRLQRG